MSIGWHDVMARYAPGTPVPPLVGSSKLVVVSVDDQHICVRQRLWQARLTRAEFETATALLASSGPVTALELAELLRIHYAGGPQVTTDCSRVPNLSAVILSDLGAVPSTAAGPPSR